ncbi:NUDIX hydrolase [Halanaeroarchaeum sulfurireducens]|uniref:Mut/nudix family protein n=1 Tax=Halanaeroarchaeum sulfurireducens TaxID=1604004 RepID=A0A0N9N7X4_9EURY|nr:CoA pyrophosphatase [Halanaeroarchaeum sulfurireducens]ALG81501.1 Mut/nudix family protein [Halanaeroarchaeum sulfurireducens]
MDLGQVAEHEPRTIDDEDRRDAAVIVPVIRREDGLHLLFIKRSDHLGEHPGQMGFPGGGREPRDDDLRQTAVREAWEEVGLRPAETEFVGQLDDITTTSGYAVSPFVATVADRRYYPDEREVSEVVVLSVDALTDQENYSAERREHPRYAEVLVHFFSVDGYTVWGATGRMLVQFLELVRGWTPPSGVGHVVDPEADFRADGAGCRRYT